MIIIEIAGHLGADPESRFTPSGQKVTTMRIATNVRKSGKDETVWWRVTIWGDRFDKMMPYIKKGSALIIVGDMQKPEIYTDREGRQQISLEITAEMIRFSPFGKGDKDGQNAGQAAAGGRTPYAKPNAAPAPAATPAYGESEHSDELDEEEMPF